jgi:hypothetical protein
MSRQDKIKSWLKLTGLFLLLVAFSAGINNIISRICTGGNNSGIFIVVQLIMSLALVGYLIWYLKIIIERYIYGGLKVNLGEICFQSEKERLLFGNFARIERRIMNDNGV